MRHFWFSYILTIFLINILLALALWIFHPSFQLKQINVSPLPDFLTLFKNNQVVTTNIWSPSLGNIVFGAQKPSIDADVALVYDLNKNQILFSKNPDKKVPMASLTKIMTSIIAFENKIETDKYSVANTALVGEDSMGLSAGETLSLEELLYGLMLHSGNDAAEVIADNYPGGREKFIEAMNQKAKALGLSDTNFTNPTGLEGDGKQYTTAHDLLIITNYALSNLPEFRKVVATFSYNIDQTTTHKAYNLENETNLLTSYPGVLGVKTGYTPEANLCLVTYLNYKGQKIIGILLGSNNRRQEMKELLDYSLKTLGITPPPHG